MKGSYRGFFFWCHIVSMGYCSLLMGMETPVHHDQLSFYLRHPRVKAFLDTIAYAEGTLNPKGYQTMFTYAYFKDFSDHPRKINCVNYKGKELCSSAAGKYQFLSKTWDRYAKMAGVRDFTPASQDKVAIQILMDEGVLPFLVQDPKSFKPSVMRLNKVWASLPGAPYGQPVRSLEELRAVFEALVKWYSSARGSVWT